MLRIIATLTILSLTLGACHGLSCRTGAITNSAFISFDSFNLTECGTDEPQRCIRGEGTYEVFSFIEVQVVSGLCVNESTCNLPCETLATLLIETATNLDISLGAFDIGNIDYTISACDSICCDTDDCNDNSIAEIRASQTNPGTTVALGPVPSSPDTTTTATTTKTAVSTASTTRSATTTATTTTTAVSTASTTRPTTTTATTTTTAVSTASSTRSTTSTTSTMTERTTLPTVSTARQEPGTTPRPATATSVTAGTTTESTALPPVTTTTGGTTTSSAPDTSTTVLPDSTTSVDQDTASPDDVTTSVGQMATTTTKSSGSHQIAKLFTVALVSLLSFALSLIMQ